MLHERLQITVLAYLLHMQQGYAKSTREDVETTAAEH